MSKHLARRRASMEAAEAARQAALTRVNANANNQPSLPPSSQPRAFETTDDDTDYYAKSTGDELEDDTESSPLSDASSISRNNRRARANGAAVKHGGA